MITLAVASAFATLASQLSDFTGGEDGLTFKVPEALQPGTEYLERAVPRRLDRRPLRSPTTCSSSSPCCSCWRCCASSTRRSAACCRRSARTTSAPRRSATAPSSTARSPASSRPCSRRSPACCSRSGCATTGPDTTLSFEIMLDVLLIVVIGGMGTIYGAVVGSVLLVLAQNYLQDLMKVGDDARCRTCRCSRRSSRPTAGCSGSASCSCSRSTTSRAASSAGCASAARARPARSRRRCGADESPRRCAGRRRSATIAAASAALLVVASGAALAAGDDATPWPTAGWEVSTPEAQGVASSALAELVDFGAANDMDSLLVVRHGRIVAEAYYAPFRPGMRHLVNSVTKAVVGTLAGIAVQRGDIASVDEPVLESFRWRTVADAEGAKAQLKIAHLLDMTSGLDWNEPLTAASPETMLQMERSSDWVGFVLDRPMAHAARHDVQLQQRRLAPALGDPGAQDRRRTRSPTRGARCSGRSASPTRPGAATRKAFAPAATACGCSRATWPRSATSTCTAANGRGSASSRRRGSIASSAPRSTWASAARRASTTPAAGGRSRTGAPTSRSASCAR